ncbi:MAG TPA: TrmH family RNA methyltransferase [Candidatus Saccharimonadales bacterium]|nr:TrmH family RNA methyltransferase [Candidatus Saccharimonadales bacterium]
MLYIALENIRSLYNVGAILRTCSFFGIKNVLLVGYSGKNVLPGGKVTIHEKLRKTDLGSDNDLQIDFLDDSEHLLKFAKENKLKLVAIEQDEKSILLNNWKLTPDMIIVFGNERDGVSKLIRQNADEIIEIARNGKHNSLNVATTAGIVIDHIVRK